MPRYSNLTQLTRVNGHMIPAKSTHCAKDAKHGLYFKWRGQWNFTAVNNFYMRVPGDDPQSVVENSIGDNKIEELK